MFFRRPSRAILESTLQFIARRLSVDLDLADPTRNVASLNALAGEAQRLVERYENANRLSNTRVEKLKTASAALDGVVADVGTMSDLLGSVPKPLKRGF